VGVVLNDLPRKAAQIADAIESPNANATARNHDVDDDIRHHGAKVFFSDFLLIKI